MSLDLDLDTRRQTVQSALRSLDKDKWPYIQQFWMDRVVYDEGGATYQRTYEMGEQGGVTFGEAIKGVAQLEFRPFVVATFSVGGKKGKTGRKGLVFRAGDYPDKAFNATPDDLRDAAAKFRPVTLNLEHENTVFDLGTLDTVQAKGGVLEGVLTLKQPVADVLADEAVGVSLEWTKDKRIVGCALTGSPRVEDAIVAAFSDQRKPPAMAETTDHEKGFFARLGKMFAQAAGEDPADSPPAPVTRAEFNDLKTSIDKAVAFMSKSPADDKDAAGFDPEAEALKEFDRLLGCRKIWPHEKAEVVAGFSKNLKADGDKVAFSNATGFAATLRAAYDARPEIKHGEGAKVVVFGGSASESDPPAIDPVEIYRKLNDQEKK